MFLKEYEEKYFKGICKASIRKELNIPESDKLKKNGTFERGLYYIIENNLNYAKLSIQTMLWEKASGEKIYISIFPSFVIKYNKVSTDLIEFISTNVRKDESIFKYIDDSGNLLECEDILIRSCDKVDNAVACKKFTALINAKYTETFNSILCPISFVAYMEITLRFKETFVLLKTAKICFETMILIGDSLSHLNELFKFLR
jgi:hypothetical protein